NCPNLKFGGSTTTGASPSFLQSTDLNSSFDYNVFATTTADAAGTEIVLAGKTFAGLQADALVLKNLNSVKCVYTDVFTGVINTAPAVADAWKNNYSLKAGSPVLFKSSDRIHPGARNVGYRFDAASINASHDYLNNLDLVTDAGNPANEAKYFVLTGGATEGTAVFTRNFGSVKVFDVARFCADLAWDDELLDFEADAQNTKSSFDFYLEYGAAQLPAWDQNNGDNALNLAAFISRAKLLEWQKPIRVDNAGKGNADAAYNVNSPLIIEADYFRIGFKLKKK
ncbi:MAG TPA: hypothetical protein VD772_05645, partial [Anseongella sp.]|nr:hypothetical protein [Anseongella sp.]